MTDILDERLSASQISAVATRIAPYIRRTPTVWADGADFALPGIRLALKFEFIQHAGSFKARGAFCQMLTRALSLVRASAYCCAGRIRRR
jgi:threonine dehydratase